MQQIPTYEEIMAEPSPEEFEAEQRLYDAAPEMYEALTAIIAGFVRGEFKVTQKRWDASDPYNPALVKAHAAIAKVRGE